MEFGFDPNRWEELAQALKQHAMDNEVARIEKTEFGTRYVIDGPLKAVDRRWLNIGMAWYLDKDGGAGLLLSILRELQNRTRPPTPNRLRSCVAPAVGRSAPSA